MLACLLREGKPLDSHSKPSRAKAACRFLKELAARRSLSPLAVDLWCALGAATAAAGLLGRRGVNATRKGRAGRGRSRLLALPQAAFS